MVAGGGWEWKVGDEPCLEEAGNWKHVFGAVSLALPTVFLCFPSAMTSVALFYHTLPAMVERHLRKHEPNEKHPSLQVFVSGSSWFKLKSEGTVLSG